MLRLHGFTWRFWRGISSSGSWRSDGGGKRWERPGRNAFSLEGSTLSLAVVVCTGKIPGEFSGGVRWDFGEVAPIREQNSIKSDPIGEAGDASRLLCLSDYAVKCEWVDLRSMTVSHARSAEAPFLKGFLVQRG